MASMSDLYHDLKFWMKLVFQKSVCPVVQIKQNQSIESKKKEEFTSSKFYISIFTTFKARYQNVKWKLWKLQILLYKYNTSAGLYKTFLEKLKHRNYLFSTLFFTFPSIFFLLKFLLMRLKDVSICIFFSCRFFFVKLLHRFRFLFTSRIYIFSSATCLSYATHSSHEKK